MQTGVRYAMRPTSVKELSASRRKRDELHAMVQAMRRLVSTGGAGAPGGDASTSSPLPQLHEVVATPSRILVFFELEPLLRRDGAGRRTRARTTRRRTLARSHARTLACSHARTLRGATHASCWGARGLAAEARRFPAAGGMITDLLSLLEKRNRLREEEARAIFVRLVLATKATSRACSPAPASSPSPQRHPRACSPAPASSPSPQRQPPRACSSAPASSFSPLAFGPSPPAVRLPARRLRGPPPSRRLPPR